MNTAEYEQLAPGSEVLCGNPDKHEPHDVVPIIPGLARGVRKVFRCIGNLGCCPTCKGTGNDGSPDTGGQCWDCRGTGHCHEGPCTEEARS